MRRIVSAILISLSLLFTRARAEEPADVFASVLQPLFQQNCVRCHGEKDKTEGDIDLFALKSTVDLLAQPKLLEDIVEALDSEYMPPEDQEKLASADRSLAVKELKSLLQNAVAAQSGYPRTPLRRMNRFQYSSAVEDLFALKVPVFALPERMMRDRSNYFQPQTGKMPAKVKVSNRALGKSGLIEGSLSGVAPFPQDLRAEHGFDNRGDHLSLSPILLESLLKLGRSVVESPQFNPKTCGIWPAFFAPPTAAEADDIEKTVRARLATFLRRAFRRPVEEELLDRYTAHVLAELEQEKDFTEAMKSVAAAAIASPRFFYLYETRPDDAGGDAPLDDFALASRLSFFLWGSIPDEELLDLAAAGKLHENEVLSAQVDRMLKDHRLKRFCDSFPTQWLQLDRCISSTPDPEKYPQFYFSKYHATMHMSLEPLLLFETVLIEDLSIVQFIDSDFSYRSDLLKAWYRNGSQGKAGSPEAVEFERVPISDRRQGGVITTAATMTMTSGPSQTKPITRGAWVTTVILNSPPEPPPADVPPLAEEPTADEQDLTLRERFAAHQTRADCAACHKRLDPLGFALENYDAAGIWRDKYENGREIDTSGEIFGRHEFADIVEFKDSLLTEKDRFARGFAKHLLSFAIGREVGVHDSLAIDKIVKETVTADYRLQPLIKQIVLSEPFRH